MRRSLWLSVKERKDGTVRIRWREHFLLFEMLIIAPIAGVTAMILLHLLLSLFFGDKVIESGIGGNLTIAYIIWCPLSVYRFTPWNGFAAVDIGPKFVKIRGNSRWRWRKIPRDAIESVEYGQASEWNWQPNDVATIGGPEYRPSRKKYGDLFQIAIFAKGRRYLVIATRWDRDYVHEITETIKTHLAPKRMTETVEDYIR